MSLILSVLGGKGRVALLCQKLQAILIVDKLVIRMTCWLMQDNVNEIYNSAEVFRLIDFVHILQLMHR